MNPCALNPTLLVVFTHEDMLEQLSQLVPLGWEKFYSLNVGGYGKYDAYLSPNGSSYAEVDPTSDPLRFRIYHRGNSQGRWFPPTFATIESMMDFVQKHPEFFEAVYVPRSASPLKSSDPQREHKAALSVKTFAQAFFRWFP